MENQPSNIMHEWESQEKLLNQWESLHVPNCLDYKEFGY